jgi:hypothetical protein
VTTPPYLRRGHERLPRRMAQPGSKTADTAAGRLTTGPPSAADERDALRRPRRRAPTHLHRKSGDAPRRWPHAAAEARETRGLSLPTLSPRAHRTEARDDAECDATRYARSTSDARHLRLTTSELCRRRGGIRPSQRTHPTRGGRHERSVRLHAVAEALGRTLGTRPR